MQNNYSQQYNGQPFSNAGYPQPGYANPAGYDRLYTPKKEKKGLFSKKEKEIEPKKQPMMLNDGYNPYENRPGNRYNPDFMHVNMEANADENVFCEPSVKTELKCPMEKAAKLMYILILHMIDAGKDISDAPSKVYDALLQLENMGVDLEKLIPDSKKEKIEE